MSRKSDKPLRVEILSIKGEAKTERIRVEVRDSSIDEWKQETIKQQQKPRQEMVWKGSAPEPPPGTKRYEVAGPDLSDLKKVDPVDAAHATLVRVHEETLGAVGRFLGEDDELFLQLQSLSKQVHEAVEAWKRGYRRCLSPASVKEAKG